MSETKTIHERLEEARAKGADILAAVDRGEDVDVADLKAAGEEVTKLEALANEAEARAPCLRAWAPRASP